MKKTLCLLLLSVLLLLSACGAETAEAVKVIEIELTEGEYYAFGVDKNQPALLAQANAFIAQMKENGTFEEICDKYFADGTPAAVVSATLDADKEQLVVATNTPFEPFEYMKGSAYYGVDMEIAAAFAAYLGQELVIVNMDFEAVCLSVAQGKCDIAMAGLTVSEDREEFVNFTDSYYQATQVLMVRADDTHFDACKTKADVEAVLSSLNAQTRIGVQTGTTGQLYIEGDENWGFTGYDVECINYKTGALAVQDMLNGNLECVVIDGAPAQHIADAYNGSSFSEKVEKFVESFAEGGRKLILSGLRNTLLIAVLGLLIGTLIGTLIAAVRVLPKYKRFPRILNGICSVYVGFFRGTPIVVQLLLGYFILPQLGLNYPALYVCVAVFGLNSGAYVSEIMRGGIASVDAGQLEAGRALGLSFGTAMVKIVIPQAVKNILPTLGNEFISLIKETSVVSFVGTLDVCNAFNLIGSNNYEFVVPYLVMAVVYILLVAVVTALVKLMERRLSRSDRGFTSK